MRREGAIEKHFLEAFLPHPTSDTPSSLPATMRITLLVLISSCLSLADASVETKQGWLDRLLVKNVLTPISGKGITTPRGMDSRESLALLDGLARKTMKEASGSQQK